uniref:Uncharacterized protein n=1 Tax=Anguilla anguilla TaxID=7936 RepID=A0A0E9XZ22_ANGAN
MICHLPLNCSSPAYHDQYHNQDNSHTNSHSRANPDISRNFIREDGGVTV